MEPLDTSKPVRFKNVLLATDFSPASENALLRALGLARRWKARLFVAHVVNPSTLFGQDAVQRAVNDAWREAHTEMTDQLIAGRLEGVENHVVVRLGDIWEELQKVMAEFHVDLLVTGTRGRSGVLKMLLGSTAEKAFRFSPVPVLTVGPRARAGGEHGPQRILYSTGFAPQSLYAGVYALSLAEQNQARVAMLHVVREMPARKSHQKLVSEAKQKLQELSRNVRLAAPPEFFVEFGVTSECILKVAGQWKPELIVLGIRRQHAPTEKRTTWATAYSVVSNATCPVLTVKAPETAA